MKTDIFTKIFFSIVLFSFVLSFFVSFISFNNQKEIEKDLLSFQEIELADFLERFYENEDYFFYILNKIEENVDFFWIYNSEELVIFSSEKDLIGKTPPIFEKTEKRVDYNNKSYLLNSASFFMEGEDNFFVFGKEETKKSFNLFFPLFVSVFFGSVFGFLLIKKVINPLVENEKKEKQKNLREKQKKSRLKEEEIKISEQFISEKVKEKTEELQKTIIDLENRVEDQKEKIEIKKEELEKFQNLTTGREKKIIELKEKIKELQKK